MVKSLLVVLGLVASVLLVYGQALGFGFVDYDDPPYVSQNPIVLAGLTWDGVAWAFSLAKQHGGNWHPLTSLAHMLDVELFGARPAGHHAVNVLLHALNAALLFGFLRSTTDRLAAPALAAALFALHPLHVESVAWVSERKDVLSTAFGLASLWAWAAWTKRGGAARYLAALALFALGLLSKPMLVTWPCVMLLCDLWPLGRWPGTRPLRLALEKLPFFAFAAASAAVTFAVQRAVGAVDMSAGVPLGARLANAAVSYVRYLAKTVWPSPLGFFYPHPDLPGGTPWSAWQVAGALVLLAALTALALACRRPYAAVGWLWYVGTLVPVIGVVQVGAQALADRYTYLTLIGPFAALAFGADELWRRRAARSATAARAARIAGGAAAALALAAFGVLAHRQARTWRSSQALYEHALRVAPRAPMVLTNLGSLCQERARAAGDPRQELERAEDYYRRALAVDPRHLDASYNLGFLLSVTGRTEEAEQQLRRALDVQPTHAYARVSLAQILLQRGEAEQAVRELERALADRPLPHAELCLASALLALGRPGEARAACERAVALDPAFGGAHFELGRMLLAEEPARAIEHLRAAAQAEPGQPAFAFELTRVLASHPDPALRDPRTAILLGERLAARTSDPSVLDVLAMAYAAGGELDTAASLARRALEGARAAGLADLAVEIEARLELYRAGHAYVAQP